MPIYTGSTPDGSDMKEFEGVYINPKNDNEWSTGPYPEQRRSMNKYNRLRDYMNGRYTLNDVYLQVKEKKCKLPSVMRKYVLSHYDTDGEFINNN
tara:strand:+ start:930 stop:1214 length:285 start_codon:yes stop_codon:yes gene_type:complete